MKISIIGAGIAGITAAQTIRQQEPAAQITVYTDEVHPLGLYARKDLARRLATENPAAEDFLIASQADLAAQGIKLKYEAVHKVFPRRNQLLIRHSARFDFDKLLIATGATPRVADAPGTHLIGVHQLREYDDLRLIKVWLDDLRQQGAVIIGGGILALDMAYTFRERDVPTTLVVRDDYLGRPLLSPDAGQFVQARLAADGIQVLLGRQVTTYLSSDNAVLDAVRLDDGQEIGARMALSAIGVRPTTDFLEESDIALDDDSGAVLVNEYLQTNFEDIYAAGSCAQVNGGIARNWQHPRKQGRAAALNMLGEQTTYRPAVQGDLDTQIYDLPLAYFGQRPDEAATRWELDGAADHYAAVSLTAEGQVSGALLIGTLASVAPRLHELAQSGETVTPAELAALVQQATAR